MQAELDALRSTIAELVPVEGRPVAPDDTVVVDLVAEDETRRDYVIELGRGAVMEEIEQGLVGMSAGETKEMAFELADGSTQSLAATVKEIKEKVLPPLDDDLARSASEFETFAERRIRGAMIDGLRARHIIEERLGQKDLVAKKVEPRLDEAETIDHALRPLSRRARLTLQLYYLERLSMKQVAQTLNVTEAAVSLLKKRTCQRLIQLLNE